MGFNLTKPLSVNGAANLLTLLKAAGYNGAARLEVQGFLYNEDAAVNCYIHFTDSNTTAPTGTDGIQFGPAAGTASKTFILPKGTDLSTTWLYAASAITVKAAIQT